MSEPGNGAVEVLCHPQDRLGEGPLWDHRSGQLLWVDILRGIVHSWSQQAGERDVLRLDALIGAVALAGNADLLLATTQGLLIWRASTRAVESFADPITRQDVRFNDGRVDAAGRFWVGTMARDAARYAEPLGVLYRIDPDGRVRQMEDGLTISNGLDWSPDGRTMYLTDTMRRTIYAYDFDPGAGTIRNRRVFVSTEEAHGHPDGLVVDSHGHVWSACFGGGGLCRYDPDGRLCERVLLPVSCPTAIAFASTDSSTAYVTTASCTLAADHAEPHAGSVLKVSLPASGRPAAVFGKGIIQ